MPDVSRIPQKPPRIFYGYIIAAAAFTIMTIFVGSFVAFGVFFKPVSTDFGWTRGATALAPGMAWIIQGISGIFMGRLCDRYGPRITVSVCGLLVGLGLFLMSQISSLWQFYVIYGLILGVGLSGGIVPMTSTVMRWFVARRGLIVGIVLSGAGVGSLVFPIISSAMINAWDWRTAYIVTGLFVAGAVVLAAQFMRKEPAQKGLEPYGASQQKGQEAPVPMAAGYTLTEAVKSQQFWLVLIVLFSIGYLANTFQVHIVPHATDLGISDTIAATIMALAGGLGIAGSVLTGRVADIIGLRKTYIIGFIVMILTFVWLIPAGELWQLIAFSIVFGYMVNGCIALQSPMGAYLFGTRSLGVILGALSFGFCVGSATGSYTPGWIFDITGSYTTAFLVCIGLGIISIGALFVLRPARIAAR